MDQYLDLEAGAERFEKPASVEWAEVDDAKVASVELLPSGELLFVGHAPGKALALLYAEGRFAVWRVRVHPKGENRCLGDGCKDGAPSAEALAPARAACGRSLELKGDPAVLHANVSTDACRRALQSVLENDGFIARRTHLTFALEPLQAQLADIERAVREAGVSGVELRYRGAGLELKAARPLSPAQHRAVLWQVFRHSIGSVPLDDKVERLEPTPDASVSPKRSPP